MDEENSECTNKQNLNNSSKIILLHNIRNNDLKNVMKEKDAVQNLTTTEVQDLLKNWKVNEWPSVDLNTIESELKYSDASDMHEEPGDTVIYRCKTGDRDNDYIK